MSRSKTLAATLVAVALTGCASAPNTGRIASLECNPKAPPVVLIAVSGTGLPTALIYQGEGALRYYPEEARRLNTMGSTVVRCDDLALPESCKADQPSTAGFDEVGAKLVSSLLRVQPASGADGRYDVRFVMLEKAKFRDRRCPSPPIRDLDIQV
jgi:hypothetical protein